MQPPLPGETTHILPGLYWARMPLPFPPSHVNCWLIRDGEGWMLVDTGANVEGAMALWRNIFADVLGGLPITRVLITHFHFDHVGLAGWMCETWQAPLLMSRTEYLMARMLLSENSAGFIQQQANIGISAGAPQNYLTYLANRRPFYREEVTGIAPSYQCLRDTDTLMIGGHAWQVRIGRGHSPEMITLHCAELNVLIGADQILPRISPYIGVVSWEPDGDPLADFLASNQSFRDLPRDTLVLPSHGDPFTGLHERIDWLDAHHAERLDTLTNALTTPMTAYEAAKVLFPRVMDDAQIGFVIGEGLAHLNRLVIAGILLRETASDGMPRYRRAA
jgi:glyoxylase-like metal-dependent hydrolase (beta-lactamase superfamily II)